PPRFRMSRRKRRNAQTSVALRIRIGSTGTEAARASRSSRLSGWHAISAFQPWPISQRVSASGRISLPPRPRGDSAGCGPATRRARPSRGRSASEFRRASGSPGRRDRGKTRRAERSAWRQATAPGGEETDKTDVGERGWPPPRGEREGKTPRGGEGPSPRPPPRAPPRPPPPPKPPRPPPPPPR